MERRQAHGDERHHEDDREVLYMTIIELWGQLCHSHLPGKAHKPDKAEDQCHSVHLVMDQLVVLVDLEDERVVDVVSTEYLDVESCCEQDENQDRCEVVTIHSGVYLIPVGTFAGGRASA